MIELKSVTKYYKTKNGKKFILKDVNLTIPPNVNVGILGVNGAGKSTFLRMLGGIDFPNYGEIVSDKTFSWPMGLGGGFQGSMTGRQNVKFVARIFGENEDEINRITEFVKEFSELGDYFDMPIKTYSSGMRSRLSFALSLAFDFDYLLIDETLSVGDARFKVKSKEALFKKMEKSNVLMVSHSMNDLKLICQSGIVLHNGDIRYFDDIKDAISVYELINKNKSFKLINKPEVYAKGAKEKVKEYTTYRIGYALIKCVKICFIFCAFCYPFFLIYFLTKKRRYKDIPLKRFLDKEEGEKIKKRHLSYRLGEVIVNNFKRKPFFTPFLLLKTYLRFKKERRNEI